MKKKDFLIVIAVIVFGMIFNAIRKGDLSINFHKSISTKAWELKDRNHLHKFPQKELHLDPVDKIEIMNIAGDIEIEKSMLSQKITDNKNRQTIRIQPTINVYHRSRLQAEKIEKNIRIITNIAEKKLKSTELTGDLTQRKIFRIETDSQTNFPLKRARVNYKLILPETVELNIKNKYGDIEIKSGGKNISVHSKHGDISIKKISAKLDINHNYGRITLLDINGQIKLFSRNSRIKINNAPTLNLNCSHSKVYINNIKNKTHIEYAGYSTITMENGNGFTLEGRHNRLRLEKIRSYVYIKNAHRPIHMKDIEGDIILDTNNCRMDLEGISAEHVVIKNAYNSVNISRISANNLDILMNTGDLIIAFDEIKEKINIKNVHSKITLIYPDSIEPFFNLQVLYGKIINRSSQEFTFIKERQRMRMLSELAEGRPEIIINTTYGDVLLENGEKRL